MPVQVEGLRARAEVRVVVRKDRVVVGMNTKMSIATRAYATIKATQLCI